MNKLPGQLSIDELLNALEKEENHDSNATSLDDNIVLSFVQRFSLTSGEHKVRVNLLWKLFKMWAPWHGLTRGEFGKRLYQIIPSNNNYIKLTKENQELADKIDVLFHKKNQALKHTGVYKIRFEHFLKVHNLSPGDLYVEADILYYLHDKWCYNQRPSKSPLGENTFNGLCRLYINHKYLAGESNMVWFGVSENITQYLEKEEVKNWRIGRIKYGKKSEKRFVPKKESKEKILYEESLQTEKG